MQRGSFQDNSKDWVLLMQKASACKELAFF